MWASTSNDQRGTCVNWFRTRLKAAVWRLWWSAGYSVTSIAKQQAEAKRLSRERWRWLETLGIETLVDVGANVGQFARGYLQHRPGSLVYSFEPLEDCFLELQREMGGVPGFTAFNVALGDSEDEVDFYRSGFSPSSSLLPMGQTHKELFPFTSEITSEKVAQRTLDSFFGGIAIRGGLLIKIDVQGAEARVLKGGRQFLSVADAVLVEVGYCSLYEGQATIQEISGFLDNYGFAFTGIIDQYLRPVDSLPVYGDALFVRRAALEPCGPLSSSDADVPLAGAPMGS